MSSSLNPTDDKIIAVTCTPTRPAQTPFRGACNTHEMSRLRVYSSIFIPHILACTGQRIQTLADYVFLAVSSSSLYVCPHDTLKQNRSVLSSELPLGLFMTNVFLSSFSVVESDRDATDTASLYTEAYIYILVYV